MRLTGIEGLAAVALLASMGSIGKPVKRPLRRYSEPLGPPWPLSRQQRRAMERKARK